MKKKSLVALLLAGAMVLSLAACGSGSSNSGGNNSADSKVGETVLKFAFNQTIENPEAQAVLEMSDALYDATEGRYSIEVYPSEQLGSQAESLEYVQAGSVDMALVANSIIEGVVPDFAIIGTPYVYDSVEHQQKLFESDALQEVFDTTKEKGFEIVAVYSLGARNVYAKKAVTSPEDLSGMKIRVMQSDTMIQMMNLMGGVGTAMGQGDVYTAIQQGTLDGAENNIITYVDLNQYEVAKEYSLTGHLMIPDEMIISTKTLEKMSAEDQDALRKVAKESITNAFEKCAALRDTYFEKAQNELGVTVHDVDIKPFQERLTDFIEEVANRSDVSKAAYQAIDSAR